MKKMLVRTKVFITMILGPITWVVIQFPVARELGFQAYYNDFVMSMAFFFGGAFVLFMIQLLFRLMRRHFIEQIWVAHGLLRSFVLMIFIMVFFEFVFAR